MEYGNIVLANSKHGFIPRAIKWFIKSKFSHSLITMPDMLDVPMCIEAIGSGVDMSRFDSGYQNNPKQGYEVWSINVSQETKDWAIKLILNELETGYGLLEYPWLMWRRLNFLFGKDIKHQNNWYKGGTICSELCVQYLTACGLNIFGEYGEGAITPQDLQDIFKANPEIFTKTYVKN